MITNSSMPAIEQSDADLVARTLLGDRDAFSQIVAKYQNLICSLAYSGIGNLGQSEDVAQETFITAWKRLRHLREPEKLRAWLCGILRNRIQKALVREGRDPARHSDTLEAADDAAATAPLPSEHAISREEEQILWRALERLPETYRDPLVLFYREHQSIETVAEQLELTEEAVKQRLSRGRKLLHEEVAAFVENTLQNTAPTHAFAGAVMAALPAVAGPSAGAAATLAAKSSAAGKWAFLSTILAPLLPILGGITAHWIVYRAAPTPQERRLKGIAFLSMWAFVLGWCAGGLTLLAHLARSQEWSDELRIRVLTGFWWLYAMGLSAIAVIMFRRILALRRRMDETHPQKETGPRITSGKRIVLVVGLYLACFAGLIQVAWEANDMLSTGLMTACMVVLGASQFIDTTHKCGTAAFRSVIKHMAAVWAVILLVLNWRLDSWVALLHGIDLSEAQRILPVWLMPALTVALVLWIAGLAVATRPRNEISGQ